MTMPRSLRTLLAPALLTLAAAAAAVTVAVSGTAHAGTVKGTVRLPPSARSGRLHQGFWRVENGSVQVRSAGAKAGTVVVLDGVQGAHAPPAKTVTVEIAGLDANPRVVVIGPGSVVEFKNLGKVTHELSIPGNTTLMPIERLNPGTFRHQRFTVPGAYVVRCSEYPDLAVSVIVVDSPYNAQLGERGDFTLPAVPDGKATLKVWSMGRWVHEEPIEIAGAKQEVTVRVAAGAAAAGGHEGEGKEPESKETEGGGASGE